MKDLSIRTRLILLVAVLLALCAGVGVIGLAREQGNNRLMESFYKDRMVPLVQLKAVADAYAIGVVDTAHKLRSGEMRREAAGQAVRRAREAAAREWKAFTGTSLVERERQLIAQAQPLLTRAEAAAAQLEALIQSDDRAALDRFVQQQLYPAVDPLGGVIAELSRTQTETAREQYDEALRSYQGFVVVSVVGLLLVLAGASILAWLLIRRISSGIAEAVRVADTVASGNLGTRIEVKRRDETGQLLEALRRMNGSLVDVVSRVRNAADSIATGSSQIATGNADLSQRTEEQASSLQQTAASMEQLTATVKHNADTANEATRLATSASAVAEQGGEVVGRVVETMQNIAASSNRIVDIIGVIDGIAFQTNILALNAAVEAARAGEQGRGFAVVAGEVRSLAQRSAQAAKEIKLLIGESVEKVEAGTRLVADAGQTMDEIVDQVRRVNHLIQEIGHASSEQSNGIGQIGDAVGQLDLVTQQNAALVEESAAAAESLRQQAAGLAQTVSLFRLSGEPATA